MTIPAPLKYQKDALLMLGEIADIIMNYKLKTLTNESAITKIENVLNRKLQNE